MTIEIVRYSYFCPITQQWQPSDQATRTIRDSDGNKVTSGYGSHAWLVADAKKQWPDATIIGA